MCGIAGILAENQLPEGVDRKIRDMQNALLHRGPDDQGIYLSSDRRAALAHTRLSIIDLSHAGHQPMSTRDGRYWITFNGEIYNYRELRSQLEAKGEMFRSHSDTEVILRLYQRHKEDCVKYLRGMFAFAIWDEFEKSCFIVRDPLGIKPLYYCPQNSRLIFASEIRAILATALVEKRLSPEGLYGYIATGSVPEPSTIVDGIHCLPAGHWIRWQKGNLQEPVRYWRVDFSPHEISLSDAREKVREALIDSIKYHFVSDVPVGIFLSGGIDSTSVVALSRHVHQGKLRTYSIAFQKSKWNEGPMARKVAEKFETEHTELTISSAMAQGLFPQFMGAMDQPSTDGFNSFCISKLAHENGAKVVMSGLGGDEMFGGYPSFQLIPQMLLWSKVLRKLHVLNPAGDMLLRLFMDKTPKLRRLREFIQKEPSAVAAYQAIRGVFSLRRSRLLAESFGCSIPGQEYSPYQLSADSVPSIQDEVADLESNCYMRNQLLRDSDVMSMTWGLELRVPFVDHVLLESLVSIPSRVRFAAKKQLLSDSVPELPERVVKRPKQGFMFPFALWFRDEWKEYFQGIELPAGMKLDSWYQQWSLSVLNLWISKHLK